MPGSLFGPIPSPSALPDVLCVPSLPAPDGWGPQTGAAPAFGGDYNPEQWSREVWAQDVRLMREAGVNLVSVGVFAWAGLERAPGDYTFGWLDEVVDLLESHGIGVDLGTPTAAPPAWLYASQADSWVVDERGARLGPGSRGMMCPSSPAYREAAASIAEALAIRYGRHPAVRMFHVHNEYGAPVSACHCPTSQQAFRLWLLERHGDLDGLNEAWGTTFWGQTYHAIEEVRTPMVAASAVNPAQQLDFRRFCSDQLLECFRLERDVIRRHAPGVPITTNFMATSCPTLDYWQWSREVDVVSNDHYLPAERLDAHVMLSMDADLTRSLARGHPWLLMEHSTSAVNWQPRNIAKTAGEMMRNSLAHFARGADGIMFFQWRASRSGAEKFHSAMIPHTGPDSRIFREVTELGAALPQLAEVLGSRVEARVAIVWDWESDWAADMEWRPSVDLDHRERVEAFYTWLWHRGVTTDFVHPEDDLGPYQIVLVPQTYLLSRQACKNLGDFVHGGGHLVVSYFSGVVDEHDRIHDEGPLGPLGKVLGLRVEEFAPLRSHESVDLQWQLTDDAERTVGDVWTEHLTVSPDTFVLARFETGPAAGEPAVTRREVGRGTGWYVATRPDARALDLLLGDVCRRAGVDLSPGVPSLETVVRRTEGQLWRFLINHGDEGARVALGAPGAELLTGQQVLDHLEVPAGGVRVVRQSTHPGPGD